MTTAQLIDMSKLPPPQVVEVPDFEVILAELKADLIGAYPQAAATLQLESEPLTKWLQRLAYRLVLKRSEMNDSALAIMLPYAQGTDLDNIGAYFDTPRLVITPADPDASPPVLEVLEDDEPYRERIHLAPRGFTVAGPEGSYVYHARSASGLVLDASATSPTPGRVVISVLARDGDGTADADLLDLVQAALRSEDIRPMTDEVIVQSATIVNYTIEAVIYTLPGPDSANVLAAAQARVAKYAADLHRLKRRPSLVGIYGALNAAGVDTVDLISPTADIEVGETEASYCTSIDVTYGGTGE